jgi:hypothetical protein
MTAAIALNLILATAIAVTIVGLLAWAIATQFRDDAPLQVPDAAHQTPSDRPSRAGGRSIAARPSLTASSGRRRDPRHSFTA